MGLIAEAGRRCDIARRFAAAQPVAGAPDPDIDQPGMGVSPVSRRKARIR